MAPFPEVSDLASAWLHWTTTFVGRTKTLSLLEWTLTLAMGLPLLYIMFLPKLPFMDLQSAVSIVTVLYTVLFLTKELTSQSEGCYSGATATESTGLTVFLPILKQLTE